MTVVSHRGNEITKHGEEGNPAVHVERSGNDLSGREVGRVIEMIKQDWYVESWSVN